MSIVASGGCGGEKLQACNTNHVRSGGDAEVGFRVFHFPFYMDLTGVGSHISQRLD